MKKLYQTISFLLIGIPCIWAQNPITTNVVPIVGTVITYDFIDTTGVLPGPAGNGQTWNYSSLTPQNTPLDQEVIPYNTAPSVGSYPGSNYVVETVSLVTGNPAYAFFNSTSSILEVMGTYTSQQGVTIIFPMSNGQTQMIFPLNYNGTFTDSYIGSYTIVVGTNTINNFRHGNLSAIYDGYGTLNLPGGLTYSNVARVKMHQHTVDSFVYPGLPIPPQINIYDGTSYAHFATNGAQKLSLFGYTRDTTVNQNGTTYGKSVLYQVSSTVGLDEIQAPYAEVSAWPNPSADYTYLNIENAESGRALIYVTDLSGRNVIDTETGFIANGENQVAIDLSHLPAGIYQIRVSQENRIWNSRVMKR